MFLEFFMGIQYPQMLSQYFFSYFSSGLFQIFQTDKPMIPFVSDELQKIYSKLLKMIVQRSIVEEASGPRSLLAIEMNKDTLFPILSIKLATSSLSTCNAAKPDVLQKKNLLKDCSAVIQSILKKPKENSPLNYNLVRNAVCLVPLNIIRKKNMSVSKSGKLIISLYECKHINAEEADQSKDQFESFVDSEAKKIAEEFSKYDMVNDRLDKFSGRLFFRNEKHTSLCKVMIFVFTLSHGQAQIERGFNINTDLLVEKLISPSTVTQRRIYDHL